MTKTVILASMFSAVALAHLTSIRHIDLFEKTFTKDALDDQKTGAAALEKLSKDLGDVTGMLQKNKEAMEQQYKDLNTNFGGVKNDNDDLKKTVEKHAADYADMVAKNQALTAAVDLIKKELDAPIIKGGKDLKDADTLAAIELQKRAHLYKARAIEDFTPDMDNLVKASDYRAVAQKMMKGGLETRDTIIKSFSTAERKAFDAASMDQAFFSPQMLGIEIDCNIECAEMLDLYSSNTVSKSAFMYPQVVSYGDIGSYQCPAKCDAELGPEGNIQYLNGRTFDFRGVFCFNRNVLQEANYDLLGFMFRSAARSYRINRNRALITGDGVNEPKGWLRGDCFTKLKTGGTTFNHIDFRRFMSSAPVEYGDVIATMHQNLFAYLAAQVDNNGRFIFGDGLMTYSPADVRERIRISNCLPDPTHGGTLGDVASPFIAGDFILAAGNWKQAYSVVEKKPMFMEQYIGGSTAWCVMYQFGAEDGGFAMCCPAARTLYMGP